MEMLVSQAKPIELVIKLLVHGLVDFRTFQQRPTIKKMVSFFSFLLNLLIMRHTRWKSIDSDASLSPSSSKKKEIFLAFI